jgi:hypothetical protein
MLRSAHRASELFGVPSAKTMLLQFVVALAPFHHGLQKPKLLLLEKLQCT